MDPPEEQQVLSSPEPSLQARRSKIAYKNPVHFSFFENFCGGLSESSSIGLGNLNNWSLVDFLGRIWVRGPAVDPMLMVLGFEVSKD